MIRHIVMMRLKKMEDPTETLQRASQLRKALDTLPASIPEIKEWDTGLNINPFPQAYDLVLISSFLDEKALDIYRNHPDHQKVLSVIREFVEELAVVDYTL